MEVQKREMLLMWKGVSFEAPRVLSAYHVPCYWDKYCVNLFGELGYVEW